MARKQTNGPKPRAAATNGKPSSTSVKSAITRENQVDLVESKQEQTHVKHEWFSSFAQGASRFTGKPATFIVAVLAVLVWAATGPYFHYSDTWQLVINTSTTIITFLMVFLIQNTQNRDMLAVQVKLAELIIAAQGAKNKIATAEDLSEEDLEALHKEYCSHAETAREHLERRRAAKAKS